MSEEGGGIRGRIFVLSKLGDALVTHVSTLQAFAEISLQNVEVSGIEAILSLIPGLRATAGAVIVFSGGEGASVRYPRAHSVSWIVFRFGLRETKIRSCDR